MTPQDTLSTTEAGIQPIQAGEGKVAIARTVEALKRLEKGTAIVISNAEDFTLANGEGQFLKKVREEIEAKWEPKTKQAYKDWKGLLAKKDAEVDPVKKREDAINAACNAWLKAEDKRKKEQDRLAKEEAARKERAAQDAIMKAAAATEKEGDAQGAADLLEQAMDYQVAPAPTEQAEVKTTVFTEQGKTTWKPEPKVTLVDGLAFAKAVVAGKYPAEMLKVELRLVPAKKWFTDKGITEFEGDGLKVEPDYAQRREVF